MLLEADRQARIGPRRLLYRKDGRALPDSDMSVKTSGRIFYGWWIVAAGFLMMFFFAGAGFYSFSIFIKPLEAEFGWSRAEISLTMSIYFLGSGFAAPLIGQLCQRYGPRRVMMAGAMGAGTCFLLISQARSLAGFYAAYVLISFSNASIGFIPVSSLLARWFVRRRGTAIGLAYVGVSIGGLALAPVVGLLTARFGWQGSYIFLGILLWILALPVIRLIVKTDPADIGLGPDGAPPAPPRKTEAATGTNPTILVDEGWPLIPALKSRAYISIAITFFLAPLAQMGVMQHQVPMIMDLGVTAGKAAMALGLIAGFGGLGKLTFGRISESIPFQWAATLCFSLQALGVIILLSMSTPFLLWIYVAVFGFAMGGVVVLQPLAVGKFFGLRSFGVLLGGITLSQALGASIGAYSAGLIFDMFASYDYALWTFVIVFLLAVLTIFMAGKPETWKEPEGAAGGV